VIESLCCAGGTPPPGRTEENDMNTRDRAFEVRSALTVPRPRRIASAAVLALALSAGIATPAMAASGGTGGDVSAPGAQFAGNQASIDQLQLTTLFTKMEQGKISAATYAAAKRSYDAQNATATKSTTTRQSVSPMILPPDVPPPPPAQRTLTHTYYAQEKGYWCGPATGKMAVKIIAGSITSRYNGAAFAQSSVAGPAHMQTESAGATTWGSGNFVRGVNRWLGRSLYQQVDSPSASTVRSALRTSIGTNGDPVAADTVEFAGGLHYNGHPTNQTIGHWILAYAYEDSGATVKFLDPSTSVWSGVNSAFTANTDTFTGRYLQSNGIAY
jgi:hypothetical protein